MGEAARRLRVVEIEHIRHSTGTAGAILRFAAKQSAVAYVRHKSL
jgi:hypothetical protein